MTKTKKNEPSNSAMSFGEHIDEFRKRIIYCLLGIGICLVFTLIFGTNIIDLFKAPYLNAVDSDTLLQTLAPTDGFNSYVKLCIISAVVLSSPWSIYQIWKFIEEGLYSKEKIYFQYFIPLCIILFVAGASFLMYIVAPLVMKFLLSFNKNVLGVQSFFSFPKYISFISGLILVFGIVFQTPIIVLFLNKSDIISMDSLIRSRKFVFWSVFVIAAIITPPDVVSQLCLALPMYLLFEIGILLCKYTQNSSLPER